MIDLQRAAAAAEALLEAHRGRQPFDALDPSIAPRDIADAYAIQEALRVRREPWLGPTVGYKVALTSRVMQKMVSFDSPFSGPLHARFLHASGTRLRLDAFGRLGIECELAARLGEDLPAAGAPYDRARIAAAVDTLAPAFELVDDRRADYTRMAPLVLTLVADNAWNGGVVLGEARTDWRALDLAAVRGLLRINGQVAAEGHGADVLGHPFEALAWLVNDLAARGMDVRAGMVVMTGSMIGTRFPAPGDHFELEVEGLGSVQADIADEPATEDA